MNKKPFGAAILLAAACGGLLAAPSAVPARKKAPVAKAAPRASASAAELARIAKKAIRGPKPFDKPSEAERFYIRKRAPDGVSPIPTEWVTAAVAAAARMPRYSTRTNQLLTARSALAVPDALAALGNWTPLGPGNVGGRTRGLVIDPVNPSIIYAGGVAGGIWKSIDAGAHWLPIGDLLPNIAVTSLVMDPKDPTILYAGTGEGFNNVDAVRGAGIFRTADSGKDWPQLASTKTSDFYYVNKLVVSPNDSSRLYAATRTGLWRSPDSGVTWTNVKAAPVVLPVSDRDLGFTDVVIRTDQTKDWVLASEGIKSRGTIWRNVDAGGDSGVWTSVQSGPLQGRASLAIAPSNQAVVYALTASIALGDWNGGLNAVYRSDDGGGKWTAVRTNDWVVATETVPAPVNNLLLSNPAASSEYACFQRDKNELMNQGWYDNVVAVDPLNPDVVWAGGIDLFRSDDGGRNWGLASYWWLDRDKASGQFPPQYAHADQHALIFHPRYDGAANRTLFVGNDGGLYRTDDARASTSGDVCGEKKGALAWTNLNNGYGVTQFYDGAVFPDGQTYFGGTQDNGTIRGTMGAGPNAWKTILGGDGGYVAVDPTSTNVLYGEYTVLSLQKSIDGGAKFADAVKGVNESGFWIFIAPFVMDPSVPSTLWLGGNTFPWRTLDGAENWTKAGASFGDKADEDRATGDRISAIAVATTDSNSVLMGTESGKIFRTSTAGTGTDATVWASVTPPEMANAYVSSIAIDPEYAFVAYATYSTFGVVHVWKSTDSGATWAPLDGSGDTKLPDIPVLSIAVDPTAGSRPRRLYVGTDIGVYVSLDGGANWAVENGGFANVPTARLAVNNSTLYAFTHGRGVWRVPLSADAPTATVSGDGTVCAGTGKTISAALTGTAPWIVTWSDGVTQSGVPESPAVRSVAPAVTTVYTVRGVSDKTGAGNASGSATVTVVPNLVPAITAPSTVWAGSPNWTANVPAHTGSTYAWGITNGTITSGQGTSQITFTGGTAGTPLTLSVTETNASGCVTAPGKATVTVTPAGSAGLFVPIVLSSGGLGGAFFTSELGLTNRGSTDASISYAYTAAFGGSSGTATDSLQAGRQKILSDAITFLKGLGIRLGDSGDRGGTLRITFTGLSSADAGAATVRTTTSVAEGRAGLAYTGLPPSRLLSAPVYLCGLRQNATDRSNVAIMNAGGPADGDVTLRLTVVSGDPANPKTQALPDIPLSPGGFNQVSGILASNGLTLTNGYVRVERISGTAPFYAYGIVNDQANSDGSFVEPVVASPAIAVTGATLPVVVETSTFSTEAVLTNLTSSARTVRCTYVASALLGGSVSFDISLLPNEQQILPDFVQVLRDRGVVPGARGPTFAGALFVTDATGDLRGISIGARTSAAGGGGRYGLFYSAVANGTEATTSAWLYGLQQNADNRTNLALVNIGSADSSTDVFRIDLYDGATGQKTTTVDDVSVPAKGFFQMNTILAQYAPGVTSGYAFVTRTSGSNPFIAYAVVNDGGQPGQRSGDGAFVAASLPVGP